MLTSNKKAGAATPANTSRPLATSIYRITKKLDASKFSGPRVFIAGKIRRNCFRHDLAPNLRSAGSGKFALQCDGFTYVGPFMDACDHGCRHGAGSHGVLGVPGFGCEGAATSREDVYRRNQFGIQIADLVVAYIDAPDCYGTIFELGFAASNGIPYVVLFAPGIDISDFWYLQQSQAKFRAPHVVSRKKLPSVFADILAQWRAAQ